MTVSEFKMMFQNASQACIAAGLAAGTLTLDAGPTVQSALPEAEEEDALHNDIIKYCRQYGLLYFHGSMAHRTRRTLGEPDFTIFLPGGRVAFVECKDKNGKVSADQLAVIAHAKRLGTTIHVVRSFAQFLEVIDAIEHNRKPIGELL